jgi:hypothetical protein
MTRRARRPGSAPAPAGAVIADVLARRGISGAVREQRLVTEWRDIVGDRVAARAWPDGLKHGVLYVRVSNSSWLQELAFFRQAIVERANRVAGPPPLVKDVRLHLGPRRDPVDDDVVAELAARRRRPRAAPPPPAPVTAAAEAGIVRDTARVSDTELRDAIRAAWRKLRQP